MTHLLIAGHGGKKNGTFDPGASGYINKGEHRYVSEDLFPAMEKFLPKNHDVIFFDEHNVYDHGDIVALAKQHNASEVTEIHFDATGSSSASGGHVIIYDGYDPDKVDLALRDAIEKMVGVRYSHRNHKGISGRSNLANINRAASAGITYRLLELGFGTNEKDAKIMTEDVDGYAKALVEAITDTSNVKSPSKKQTVSKKPIKPKVKTVSQMADEVLASGINGNAARAKFLGLTLAEYEPVRQEINKRYGQGKSKPKQSAGKSVSQMADMIIKNSKAPTGHEARRKWLGIDDATYQKVRAEVNKRL